MKKLTWRKQHKWAGIILSFFLLMFCASGIVLNHRALVSDTDVSRKYLPSRYEFRDWNNGLLRGTVRYRGNDSVPWVLVYGNGGIWKSDADGRRFSDFNSGLPDAADSRQIKSVVNASDSALFAVSLFGLYRYDPEVSSWTPLSLPKDNYELLADAFVREDTLIVAGRSNLYISVPPYSSFRKIQLRAPAGYRKQVSLFRTVWMLHSGELFGMPGRLVADLIAVVLIVLCITGLIFWLSAGYVRKMRRRGRDTATAAHTTRLSLLWHDRVGRLTIVFTLFIAITGWCLRPPVMIPLALNKVPVVPGTALESDNPWHDKLRMIRYDDNCGDWLLSTSDGFYSLKSLRDTPLRVNDSPPVSVMGLNVFSRDRSGRWLCGSFSGMFVWDRERNSVSDYFTRKAVKNEAGPPFGKRAISGYSSDFNGRPFTVEYDAGTKALAQPADMATLPMSLWNLTLEVHNGRIYMGNAATYIFVFIAGIGIVWCLWTGWKLRIRKKA